MLDVKDRFNIAKKKIIAKNAALPGSLPPALTEENISTFFTYLLSIICKNPALQNCAPQMPGGVHQGSPPAETVVLLRHIG